MGVFISWSGKNTKSHLVAIALRGWLQQVIQGCNPWVSVQDIDAGERWGTELFSQLDKHSVGIICITKENQAEPWLNFEAGALAKQLKGDKADESRVCPLLIEMATSDVVGPFKLLQMVPLDKEGMFQISQMVNKHTIATPLSEEVLKKVFEKFWPDLHVELQQMKVPEQAGKSSRSTPEMLEEILSLARSIDRATNLTASDLSKRHNSAGFAWDPIAQDMHFKLVGEVEKINPEISAILNESSPAFDDQTLTLVFSKRMQREFEFLTTPSCFEFLKKTAVALGYQVNLMRGITVVGL
jgi:hypothetical protein